MSDEKLYRVELKRVMYVLAPTETDAEKFALEARTNSAEIKSVKITKATKNSVSKDGWHGCEPWGIKSNLTCNEILNENCR